MNNDILDEIIEKSRTKGAKDKRKRSLKDRIKTAFSPKEKAKDHPAGEGWGQSKGGVTTPPKDADVQLRALKRSQKRRR